MAVFTIDALALSSASHAIDPLGGTGCGRGLSGEWWWSDWRFHCVNGGRERAW